MGNQDTGRSRNECRTYRAGGGLCDKTSGQIDRNRKILNENLAVLEEWIQKHKPLFELIPPRAGGVAFLRYNMKINSTELADKFLKEKSVFIIADDFFGMDHYIRIGIGTEKDYFKAGLKLIDETLEEISGNSSV